MINHLRMGSPLAALSSLALAALLGGCSTQPVDVGFGIALTITADDSSSDADLARMTQLRFRTSGDESEKFLLQLPGPLRRTERLVYRPRSGSRQLTVAVDAEDETGAALAVGSTGSLSIPAGQTLSAQLVLVALGQADAGPDDLGASDGSADDLAGDADLGPNTDLANATDLDTRPPIVITPLTGGSSATDGLSYTTGTISVRIGKPVVIDVFADAAATGDRQSPNSISGATLTFTRVAELIGPNPNFLTLSRWVALPTLTTSGTLTLFFSNTQDGAVWSVYEVDRAGPTTGNGAGIFAQHITGSGSGSTLGLTLLPFSDPGNAVVAAFSAENQASVTFRTATPRSGWTELHDIGEGLTSYSHAMETQYLIGVDRTPSVTWTLTGLMGGLASEIKIAP